MTARMTQGNPLMASAAELRTLIAFEDLIDPVSQAFQQSSAGQAQNGLIVMLPADRPDMGDVYVKTGVLARHPVHIVKISPWFAANVTSGAAQGGFIAVLDSRTGHTLAILNEEHYLSDIRTAAAGALAARTLAPEQVATAAVLGAGVQAYWQTLALFRERPFKRLLLWARDGGKAASLSGRLQPHLPGVTISVAQSVEAAVREADVLITATLAREPLVKGAWLRPGQHITAIGADDPSKCELDAEVLRRARVFVDSRESACSNGDIHRAVAAGDYDPERVAGEIGDILSGHVPGRTSPSDITLAKFVGIGALDLVAAETAIARLMPDAFGP